MIHVCRHVLQSPVIATPIIEEMKRILTFEGTEKVVSLAELRQLVATSGNYGELASG